MKGSDRSVGTENQFSEHVQSAHCNTVKKRKLTTFESNVVTFKFALEGP